MICAVYKYAFIHSYHKIAMVFIRLPATVSIGEILSFVYQWYHKLSPSYFVNYFNPISSINSYNARQSQITNLFVKSVHATQYGIRSLSYTGLKL